MQHWSELNTEHRLKPRRSNRLVGAARLALKTRLAQSLAAVQVARGLESLARASQAVWSEWAKSPALPQYLTRWLQEAPTLELLAASSAAHALFSRRALPSRAQAAEARLHEVVSGIKGQLARLEPSLIHLYRGACTALELRSPDYLRHFSVSLRELLTQVLHLLAPDDALRSWSEATPNDFPSGRPTRALRLRYIYRRVATTEYAAFVEDDVKRTVELLELLQSGVHKISAVSDPRTLRLILRRAEGVLALLLEAGLPGSSELSVRRRPMD